MDFCVWSSVPWIGPGYALLSFPFSCPLPCLIPSQPLPTTVCLLSLSVDWFVAVTGYCWEWTPLWAAKLPEHMKRRCAQGSWDSGHWTVSWPCLVSWTTDSVKHSSLHQSCIQTIAYVVVCGSCYAIMDFFSFILLSYGFWHAVLNYVFYLLGFSMLFLLQDEFIVLCTSAVHFWSLVISVYYLFLFVITLYIIFTVFFTAVSELDWPTKSC